jgi:hypothetical protein
MQVPYYRPSSSLRTTVYPPSPSCPRRHPVGQTCRVSLDWTRDRSKSKLPSPTLKVAQRNDTVSGTHTIAQVSGDPRANGSGP